MARLRSIGVLYALQDLFTDIDRRQIDRDGFLSTEGSLGVAAGECIAFGEALGWISVTTNGVIVATQTGRDVHQGNSRAQKLRRQLKAFVFDAAPPWRASLSRGRVEAINFVPANVAQVLRDSGLMGQPDAEIVEWWDDVASLARQSALLGRTETGREGEALSMSFELSRVRRSPTWQAIESNLAGYDILSQVSSQDAAPLPIEVKASRLTSEAATFHVTANEWRVAALSARYAFHLWLLGSANATLWVLTQDDIQPHIPLNQGAGAWQDVEIGFSAVVSGSLPAHETARLGSAIT